MKKLFNLKNSILVVLGAFVGALNGLLGGGGGTLVVPLYQTAGELDTKKAHATAIATMLPLSLVSGAFYLARGDFEWRDGLFVCLGVVIGGLIGAVLLKKLQGRLISVFFYLVMIYAGIRMVI